MRGLEAERIRAQVRSRLFQTAVEPVQVDRYVIEARVGEGGMGTVYRARDPELQRDVALKLLRSADGSSDKLLAEARAMAKLEHPNLLGIHDVGVHQEQVFLVMKYVDGENLAQWLRSARRTPAEVARVFTAAARGLAAAHRAGIVHRDFKPENVLIDRSGHVFVADFGLARDTPETETRPPAAASPHTGVAGTPAYMAPEVLDGERASARSDQFAFCVALHEALHGTRPFRGVGIDVLREAQRHPPAQGAEDVPAWLDRLAARGLRAEPAQRHASMDEIIRLLERGPSRGPLWTGAAVGVVALAGVGWMVRPPAAVTSGPVPTVAPVAVTAPSPSPAPVPDAPAPKHPPSKPPPVPAAPPPSPGSAARGGTFTDVIDEANVAVRSVPFRECWSGTFTATVAFHPAGNVRKVRIEPYAYKRQEPPTEEQYACLERLFGELRIKPFELDENLADTTSARFDEDEDGAGAYVPPSSTAPANTKATFEDVFDDGYALMKSVPFASCGYTRAFTVTLRFAESGEPYEVKISGAARATPEQRDCLRELYRKVRVKLFNRAWGTDDGFTVLFP